VNKPSGEDIGRGLLFAGCTVVAIVVQEPFWRFGAIAILVLVIINGLLSTGGRN